MFASYSDDRKVIYHYFGRIYFSTILIIVQVL